MALHDTTEAPLGKPDYDFPGWETTPGGFVLYVRVRSAWLNIHVLMPNFHRSPIALEAAQTNKANLSGDSVDDPDLWDYLDVIASHFLPELQKLAPAVRHVGKLTLADLQARQYYKLVVNNKGIARGQLYYWIDIDRALTWQTVEQAPREIREKWASQIQKTVSTLHALDVVWGDVKADNVVIDKSGNAIVIDFEGGATKGWVDKDKMETKEGDLQGLERLMDYIFNDNCPLRLREKDGDSERCCTEC
ncbi:uncharacterized protein BDZ99DRAFT_401001 [Mytilinidion resinicola]|uniref:Protein kinase domain-containing protein n=1 Tax=Mytilinidion resinicola TaxID=574789 RepID=A0A6A6Y219_9PEZI|nr:uncharacterized protein BDZ99DRAFT_401001 [Mytilinidion resinicola]KAF2802822.1 hypothetical protein BDZ99DRAFT_401001 [Mytilinidion resinicola]